MKHIGLFEGIGGFSLAARWMGWDTVAWCEWDKMCQQHLRYHFPEAEGFGDITKTDFTKYADKIDLLTGGFPCQPFSTAGKRQGTADTRYLWPEMLRAIREIRPRWIVGENVRGLVNWDGGVVFNTVQADLEAQGYEVLPFLLPACAVDAPHRRDRIWFVAHSDGIPARHGRGKDHEAKREIRLDETGNVSGELRRFGDATHPTIEGLQERKQGGGWKNKEKDSTGVEFQPERFVGDGYAADTNGDRLEGGLSSQLNKQASSARENASEHISGDPRALQWQNFPTQSPICGGDDGIPSELDGITFSKWRQWSIKSYGNAVVPQVVYKIYKAIELWETSQPTATTSTGG